MTERKTKRAGGNAESERAPAKPDATDVDDVVLEGDESVEEGGATSEVAGATPNVAPTELVNPTAEEVRAALDAGQWPEEWGPKPGDSRPHCPHCRRPLGAGSTQGPITYYYCENERCAFALANGRKWSQKVRKRTFPLAAPGPEFNARAGREGFEAR